MNYYICTHRVSPRYPQIKFSAQRRSMCIRVPKTRDMRQQEKGDKAEGEQNKGEDKGVLILGGPA